MFITRGLSLTVQLCSAPSEKLFLPKPCDTDEAWSPAQPMSATAACTCQHKSLISQRRPSDGTALAGPCCKKGPTYLLNGGRGQAPRSSEITRIFTSWNNPGFVFFLCIVIKTASVQFSSVAHSCPTLCDPMNHSTPGLPVHYQLPEFTQTHVHRVGDAIQPSHPLSSPSPPALNLSQHQGLFKWVSSSHQVAKELEF